MSVQLERATEKPDWGLAVRVRVRVRLTGDVGVVTDLERLDWCEGYWVTVRPESGLSVGFWRWQEFDWDLVVLRHWI